MRLAHLVPQAALLVGAAVALLVALFGAWRRQGLAAVVAGLAVLATAGFQVDLLRGPALLTLHGMWALDGVAQWAVLLVCGATLLVLLTTEWLRSDARYGEYHAILLFAALGAMMMATAADLLQLLVAVLLTSAMAVVLASYHRGAALSVEAGVKLFLLGGLTNALMLLGAVLLYGAGGTTLYGPLDGSLAAAPAPLLAAAVGLLAVGLAFELGAVPAHAWMPDVAEGAPVPSAAFLTVVPKIGAVVALARLVSILPDDQVAWRPLVAAVAAVTMTLGNLGALAQPDLRRLLGWSSVSQTGYALMAVVAVGRSGRMAGALLLFLLAYAVANVGAFAVVAELRGRTAIEDYRGLSRRRPVLAAILTLCLLSLVGIPPLVGFTAKLELFLVSIEVGYGWLAALAVANTVVSLVYALRVIGPVYLDDREAPVPVLGPGSAVAAGLAGVGVVALGLLTGVLLTALAGATLLP